MASVTPALTPVGLKEVQGFAARQGVGDYLPAVLAMTQRLFPDALRLALRVEDDPEIPNDAHLIIEVDIPFLDAEQYVDAKFRWSRELFGLCPAPLVCVFRSSINITES